MLCLVYFFGPAFFFVFLGALLHFLLASGIERCVIDSREYCSSLLSQGDKLPNLCWGSSGLPIGRWNVSSFVPNSRILCIGLITINHPVVKASLSLRWICDPCCGGHKYLTPLSVHLIAVLLSVSYPLRISRHTCLFLFLLLSCFASAFPCRISVRHIVGYSGSDCAQELGCLYYDLLMWSGGFTFIWNEVANAHRYCLERLYTVRLPHLELEAREGVCTDAHSLIAITLL